MVKTTLKSGAVCTSVAGSSQNNPPRNLFPVQNFFLKILLLLVLEQGVLKVAVKPSSISSSAQIGQSKQMV